MNIKIEAVKALLFTALGAFLFAKYSPKPEPKNQSGVEQNQLQMQDCKVVIKKVTNKDGSVDEVTEFLSNNSQKQSQKIQPPKPENQNKLFLGLGTEKKLTLDLQRGNIQHQIISDGNKDHSYYLKFKVLEF